MRTLVLSLTLVTSFAMAQTTVKPEKQWGEIVTGLMRKGDVPGLSVAVVRDGKILWEREVGQKDAVTDRVTDGPVLRDTLFSAASLSKPVFAYIVLRLVDRPPAKSAICRVGRLNVSNVREPRVEQTFHSQRNDSQESITDNLRGRHPL